MACSSAWFLGVGTLISNSRSTWARRNAISRRRAPRSSYYGEWFGPYPYGHITIVDPAYQSGAGGMEYPTLFTVGTRWLAPAGVLSPEGVKIHEAGHQFWFGIVANNEFEHAWLDEGFKSFSEERAAAEAYTPNYLGLRFFGGFVPWTERDVALNRATDLNGLYGYREAAKADAKMRSRCRRPASAKEGNSRICSPVSR